MNQEFDALLIVGFGGPEKKDDVIPFLENVLRGRNVPRERMLEVAEHYYHFGGVSPINAQTRQVIEALREELDAHGIALPISWGNRNWHPLLEDTIQELTRQGKRRVLALVLSAYSSYSSCRQYLEDIERARQAIGPEAPPVEKIRVFHNHPGFIEANADRLASAMTELTPAQRNSVYLVFTAHSLPQAMARTCAYEEQLRETCRLVAEKVGIPPARYELVYQSRSGRPQDPWLEPDVRDFLRELPGKRVSDVVLFPIGFLSDHMEVLFDLDEEAKQTCDELGLRMIRVPTVGTHPRFIAMLRELIEERMNNTPDRRTVGKFSANPDFCPADCCPAPPARRPPA